MSTMVEVRVPNLDCEGCASKLKKALFKLKGVDEVWVKIEEQKVTVRGHGVELERKVFRAIKRAGKAAEPWPYSGALSHFTTSLHKYPTFILNHYYHDSSKSEASNGVHTFFHTPSLYSVAASLDEPFASLFSDENPHACTLCKRNLQNNKIYSSSRVREHCP